MRYANASRHHKKHYSCWLRQFPRGNCTIHHICGDEKCQQRIPLGNAPSKPCRLPAYRSALGSLRQKLQRMQFMVSIPDRRTMRRLYNILHILQGGLDNASGRSDMWICDICRRKRPCRNRLDRTRVLCCQITLKDEKQNRTREAYSIHDDTAVLPQERGQQDPLRGMQQA